MIAVVMAWLMISNYSKSEGSLSQRQCKKTSLGLACKRRVPSMEPEALQVDH